MNSAQLKAQIQQLTQSFHGDPGVRAVEHQAVALYQIAYVLTALNEQQNPPIPGFVSPVSSPGK